MSKSFISTQKVVDMRKCLASMRQEACIPLYAKDWCDSALIACIFEDINHFRAGIYTYQFMDDVKRSTKNVFFEIRAAFENFLSFECNIPETKEDGEPMEILIKVDEEVVSV